MTEGYTPMLARLIAASALCAAALSGCMATPAEREKQEQGLDPRKACIASCNRAADICSDQRAAQSTGSLSAPQEYGMTAVCNSELRQCLTGCGGGN